MYNEDLRELLLWLVQMIEELFMAVLMSVAFTLPVYYLCQMQGSFFVFWLAWLISLADGIGEVPNRTLAAAEVMIMLIPDLPTS